MIEPEGITYLSALKSYIAWRTIVQDGRWAYSRHSLFFYKVIGTLPVVHITHENLKRSLTIPRRRDKNEWSFVS